MSKETQSEHTGSRDPHGHLPRVAALSSARGMLGEGRDTMQKTWSLPTQVLLGRRGEKTQTPKRNQSTNNRGKAGGGRNVLCRRILGLLQRKNKLIGSKD